MKQRGSSKALQVGEEILAAVREADKKSEADTPESEGSSDAERSDGLSYALSTVLPFGLVRLSCPLVLCRVTEVVITSSFFFLSASNVTKLDIQSSFPSFLIPCLRIYRQIVILL